MNTPQKYRIMGIDPGTNYMGYGVLEVEGRTVRTVVLGDIDLHRLTDPYAKLRHIFERVGALADEYAPREVALESPFFGENVQSMLKLGRAQGVAMAAVLCRGLQVSEYAPTRIKQAITGRGAATKEQVAAIVCRTLAIDRPPKPRTAWPWPSATTSPPPDRFAPCWATNGRRDSGADRSPSRSADRRAGSSSCTPTPTGRSNDGTVPVRCPRRRAQAR